MGLGAWASATLLACELRKSAIVPHPATRSATAKYDSTRASRPSIASFQGSVALCDRHTRLRLRGCSRLFILRRCLPGLGPPTFERNLIVPSSQSAIEREPSMHAEDWQKRRKALWPLGDVCRYPGLLRSLGKTLSEGVRDIAQGSQDLAVVSVYVLLASGPMRRVTGSRCVRG